MNPNRHFYRIGEVSELVGVPSHVLRYWEAEFSVLSPQKGSGGQRLYKPEDINCIKEIKSLLYARGYTIDGARKALASDRGSGPGQMDIDRAVRELGEIAEMLAD